MPPNGASLGGPASETRCARGAHFNSLVPPWCYNKIRKDGCVALCQDICPDCACIGGIVVIATAPLGCLIGLIGGLLMGLVKWLPGSFHRSKELCEGYCAVIQKGVEHYDVEDGRTQPTQNRGTIASQAQACGDKCGAEFYCCMLPAFLVFQLLYPVLTLIVIVIVCPVNGACKGCNAGCGLLPDFCDRLKAAFRDIDAHTSEAAYGGGGHNWMAPAPPPSAQPVGRAAQFQEMPAPQQQFRPAVPPRAPPAIPVAYATQPVAYAQPPPPPPRRRATGSGAWRLSARRHRVTEGPPRRTLRIVARASGRRG